MTTKNDVVWVPAVGVVPRNATCPASHTHAAGLKCYVCDDTGRVPVVKFISRKIGLLAVATLVGPDHGDAIPATIDDKGSVYVGSAGWDVHGQCSPADRITGPHARETARDALARYHAKRIGNARRLAAAGHYVPRGFTIPAN